MSYVSRTLGGKEHILYLTGYHWIYWVATIAAGVPFVGIALGGLPYDGWDFVLLAATLIPFCYAVYYFIHGIALEVAVTSDRFVKKTGLVSITSEEVSLDKIEEVNVSESILGRIFGYGNVDVHGTGAGAIHVTMVNDPVRLRREIQSAREHIKSRGE